MLYSETAEQQKQREHLTNNQREQADCLGGNDKLTTDSQELEGKLDVSISTN